MVGFIVIIVAIGIIGQIVSAATHGGSSTRYNGSNFCNHETQRMFEENRRLFMEQQQRTMEEQNLQEQQRFMDQFMRDSLDFSTASVTPFELGGFNMDFGNSFNDFN